MDMNNPSVSPDRPSPKVSRPSKKDGMVKVRKEEGVGGKVVDGTEGGEAADWEHVLQLPGPTEIDNPPSNFSRTKMQAISINPCQEPTIYMLYTSVNSPQSLKTVIVLGYPETADY